MALCLTRLRARLSVVIWPISTRTLHGVLGNEIDGPTFDLG